MLPSWYPSNTERKQTERSESPYSTHYWQNLTEQAKESGKCGWQFQPQPYRVEYRREGLEPRNNKQVTSIVVAIIFLLPKIY